jgi:hypothetical protein
MNRLLASALLTLCAATAGADVWTDAYLCDGTTPLSPADPDYPNVYRDIMVGTRLTLLLRSDTGRAWSGYLLVPYDTYPVGSLAARDPNDQTGNYEGSILPAACPQILPPWHIPIVSRHASPKGVGFYFAHFNDAVPGDWYVLDYHANDLGPCTVNLYTDLAGLPAIVSSLLAAAWRTPPGPDPNRAALDLNADARLDYADLALFSEYWLARTDCECQVEAQESDK